MTTKAIALAAVLAMPTAAAAATYDFVYDFDGTGLSLASGSDTPSGTSLVIGDVMNIIINAQAGYAWLVDTTHRSSFDASYYVQSGGQRVADMVLTGSLNGVEVFQDNNPNTVQANVHAGGQQFDYTAGDVFDQWSLSWTFKSTTATETIIQSNDFLVNNSIATNNNLSYIQAPDVAPVPVPASLPLLLGALGFAGYMSRRKAA